MEGDREKGSEAEGVREVRGAFDPDALDHPDAFDPDLEPEAFDEPAAAHVDRRRHRFRVVAAVVLLALVFTGPAAWLLLRGERGSVTYEVPAYRSVLFGPDQLREGDRLVCSTGSAIEVPAPGGPRTLLVQGPGRITTWEIERQPGGGTVVRCS